MSGEIEYTRALYRLQLDSTYISIRDELLPKLMTSGFHTVEYGFHPYMNHLICDVIIKTLYETQPDELTEPRFEIITDDRYTERDIMKLINNIYTVFPKCNPNVISVSNIHKLANPLCVFIIDSNHGCVSDRCIKFTSENPQLTMTDINDEAIRSRNNQYAITHDINDTYEFIKNIYETTRVFYTIIYCNDIDVARKIYNTMIEDKHSVRLLDDCDDKHEVIDELSRGTIRSVICVNDDILDQGYFETGCLVINCGLPRNAEVYRKRILRVSRNLMPNKNDIITLVPEEQLHVAKSYII